MRKIKIFILLALAMLVSSSIFAQDAVSVKGIVLDAKTKETLIGVTIMIKGTQRGATTDFDGKFEINVPSANSELVFSYIGYSEQTVSLKGQQTLRIQLEPISRMIDDVIVVGYATQKKESLIGSIVSMNNEDIVSLPVTNLTQALSGRLAGVQVVQPSGEVGRDEASVYVRGMATYVDSRPLIMVDGVVRESFAQIDPNEVQSISVLKDASATAVFGVKGANGVIIVTTKRGMVSDKPQVSFSAQVAITQPTRIPDPLGSYQASVLKNLQNYGQNVKDAYSALDIIKYRTHASPYTHPDTHWIDEVIKDNSTLQQYNLNVSGGNNFVKYFVSGGYLTQDGFYKHDDNTNFSRYNLRSNFDFTITPRFTAAFNLGARIEDRTYPGGSYNNSWNIYRGAFATGGRHSPVYNPDGSYAGKSKGGNLIGVIKDQGVYRESSSTVEMGLNLKYDLSDYVKGLSVRAQVAYDNSGGNSKLWQNGFSVYDYNLEKDTYTQYAPDNAYLNYSWSSGDSFDQKVYLEGGLEYASTFNEIHSFTALFLANRNKRTIRYYVPFADQGLVGRVTYDFDKRYFAEVNVGYNGSENFSSENRYGFFPAFALGWILSNEKFLNKPSINKYVSLLKMRGSIGWVGNDRFGDITKSENQDPRFSYIQTYSTGGGPVFGVGNGSFGGIYQGKIANADVTWETGRKMNIGFESLFFSEKVGFNIDFFQERRQDILTDISSIIPNHVGASFKLANVGIVENKGIEMEGLFRGKVGKDFNYSIKGNYSFTRNKVIEKSDPVGMLAYQKEAGYSIGVPLVYEAIGIFQTYEEIYNSPNQMTLPGNVEVKPGDLKYRDFNNDGKIDINDAFRQGYGSVPEIQYGITISGSYKNFDFSAMLQGSAHSQFGKNWEIMWPFSNADNVYEKHWRYWSPEMAGNEEFVRLYGYYQNNEPGGANGSTYSYSSGDYIRLKTAEVGYTLPNSIVSKLYMSSVRFYLSGNNVLSWIKEPYLDPDNRDQRGGVMPPTRAFNFGVNINF